MINRDLEMKFYRRKPPYPKLVRLGQHIYCRPVSVVKHIRTCEKSLCNPLGPGFGNIPDPQHKCRHFFFKGLWYVCRDINDFLFITLYPKKHRGLVIANRNWQELAKIVKSNAWWTQHYHWKYNPPLYSGTCKVYDA